MYFYFSLSFLFKEVLHHRGNCNWKIVLHLHTKMYEICFYFTYMWNRHVDGLWLLNSPNLCMCCVYAGVVTPIILFCSRSLFFYISRRFCCQTLSYSQIENTYVQHTCKNTCECSINCKRRLPFWLCSSFWLEKKSLEIPLHCWRLAITSKLSWIIDFPTMFFFFLWTTCSKDKGRTKRRKR
jgi:hypothetical protein